jgi:hypothetical protein
LIGGQPIRGQTPTREYIARSIQKSTYLRPATESCPSDNRGFDGPASFRTTPYPAREGLIHISKQNSRYLRTYFAGDVVRDRRTLAL